jgi:hypothetical protein
VPCQALLAQILEQFELPIVRLLGKFEFSPGLRGRGKRLVIGGIEQLDVLLSFREKRFFLVYDGLIRTPVQPESTSPFFSGTLGLTATSITIPCTVGVIGVV